MHGRRDRNGRRPGRHRASDPDSVHGGGSSAAVNRGDQQSGPTRGPVQLDPGATGRLQLLEAGRWRACRPAREGSARTPRVPARAASSLRLGRRRLEHGRPRLDTLGDADALQVRRAQQRVVQLAEGPAGQARAAVGRQARHEADVRVVDLEQPAVASPWRRIASMTSGSAGPQRVAQAVLVAVDEGDDLGRAARRRRASGTTTGSSGKNVSSRTAASSRAPARPSTRRTVGCEEQSRSSRRFRRPPPGARR